MLAKNTNIVGMADNWASFSKHIFGDKKPSDVQYTETRRAFMAGYVSAFTDMTNRIAAMSEAQAMIKMNAIEREIAGYLVELIRGEA